MLVNTTSVGMHPAEDQSPVAASALAQFSIVFDVIYAPLETQLLKVGSITHQSPGLLPTPHHSPVPHCKCILRYAIQHQATYLPAILLQDARAAGCTPISGLEMFVGQAADQFKLFTGKDAPVDLMRQTVLDSLAKQ